MRTEDTETIKYITDDNKISVTIPNEIFIIVEGGWVGINYVHTTIKPIKIDRITFFTDEDEIQYDFLAGGEIFSKASINKSWFLTRTDAENKLKERLIKR